MDVISVAGPLWWRGRLVLRSVDFTILDSLMSGDEYTVCDVSGSCSEKGPPLSEKGVYRGSQYSKGV